MAGALVAFEGIDQAGKQTQVLAVQARAHELGLSCELRAYPDYDTPVGHLLRDALRAGLPLDARARTMLFAANRWEKDGDMRALQARNALVLVDRYTGSNLVYGLAQGYDEAWLRGLEAGLLQTHLTVVVDISPAESMRRKARDRDGFERDLRLLEAAREHALRLAAAEGWAVVDGARPAPQVTREILQVLQDRLSPRFPTLAHLAP